MRSTFPSLRSFASHFLFLSATIFVGCQRADERTHTKKETVKAEVAVEAVRPQRKSIPRVVEQPGAIHAYEESQLFARVPGYLRLARDANGKIEYDIGRRVTGPKFDETGKEIAPGEVLAEMIVPELVDEVHQKKALTRKAEAEVEQARKALAAAEANISSMDAAVAESKALLERWDSESKRIATLVKNGVIDAQSRDESYYQMKAAAARVTAAEAAVRKAKADRDKSAADVTSAEAKIDVAKAEADRTETMLRYSKIHAPFDGVIVARRVSNGDFVQPSAGKGEWLFTVARLDPVRVVISVPEVDAGMLQLEKSEVKLNVPALAGQPLSGSAKLARTSWGLDPATRSLRTEIDIPNKDGRLRPGMYVYAKITTASPESWTLPVSAVAKHGDVMVCYRIDGEGKAKREVLQVGRSDGISIEVLRRQRSEPTISWDDYNGEGVYASRAANLSDGQKVQVKEASR